MTTAPNLPISVTHQRQQSLNLSLPNRVSVIGCGGVGSWCAVFLALAGVPELHLWDADDISETNLNRLPMGPSYLGLNKAGALKHYLFQLTPQCDVFAIPNNWSLDNTGELVPDWIIAATDSHASRLSIYDWCNNGGTRRCQYVEVSAEGEFGGCTDSPAMFTTDLEANPGYQSIPVWVGPCVGAAIIACTRILHPGHLEQFNLRLGFNADRREVQLQSL
jgi:molybdopterin/thiamine biosynthesis adenylyltransferase